MCLIVGGIQPKKTATPLCPIGSIATFGCFLGPMLVYMPYMEHMGDAADGWSFSSGKLVQIVLKKCLIQMVIDTALFSNSMWCVC